MKWSDERGSALVVVFMVTLVTFMLGSALLSIATLDKKISINQTDEMKALNIAEAGADMAIAMLKKDPEKIPVIAGNQPMGEGNLVSVTVTRDNINSTYDQKFIDIISKGKVKGIEKVIDVRLEVDILPSFDFGRGFTAISTTDISFGGSTTMDTNIRAKCDITLDNNINIVGSVHTEGSFFVTKNNSVVNITNDKIWANVNVSNSGTINGPIEARGNVINNGTINGNIKALGSVTNNGTINGNVIAGGTITGKNKISGSITESSNSVSVAQFVAPSMPVLERQWFEDAADEKHTTSTTMTINLGELGNLNDKIIFVRGNINLQGTYRGRGAVVVLGNISFSGDIKRNDTSPTSKDSLAIISLRNEQEINGNMSFAGSTKLVEGLVLCDGTFTLGGNATINGAMIIRNYASNGGPVLNYNQSLTASTPLGLPGNFKIVSWQEKYN